MTNPLERKSLPVRLADIMEKEMRSGKWGGLLPGHRVLMSSYSVSAKTCLGAIAQLESRGVISKGEQGKKRRILVSPESSQKSLSNLLIIDGIGVPSGEDLLQLHSFQTAWEESGGMTQSMKVDFPRYRRPGSLLKEAVLRYRADAILLHVPSLAWVDAAVKLCPVFLSGGEWRGEITGVSYNIREEITKAVLKLRALGHSRIVVPFELLGRKMEDAIREGLAAGLDLRPDSPQVRDFCPVFSEHVPAAWQKYWKKLFASVKPTALILSEDIHVQSLYGFCFNHGIRIPQDLSVICLESTSHLEWCEPVPTRMRFPVNTATSYFKKWIRGGCRPMGMRFLSLEPIEAGTLAPPRNR